MGFNGVLTDGAGGSAQTDLSNLVGPSATELAAKTVPAMREVIAFPNCVLVCAHMRRVGERHSQDGSGMVGFFIKVVSCCNRRERFGGQV